LWSGDEALQVNVIYKLVLFVLLLQVAMFRPFEAVAGSGDTRSIEDLFFGSEHEVSENSALWKWAKDRKMWHLAIARKPNAISLSILDDRKNKHVNLIAKTNYPAHVKFRDLIDIKYRRPGNMVFYFHDNLSDALSRQYEMFEGGKDLFRGWPKWDSVKNRIDNGKKNHCVYRFSYFKSEIYASVVLIDAKSHENLQRSCIRAALYIALGARYLTPEMEEAQSDALLNAIAPIYRQNFSPGMSRIEFRKSIKIKEIR